MVFKASKKRQRKAPERVGKGSPITPSYALELWYQKQVNAISKAMIEDYRKEIGAALTASDVKKFFATDSASGIMAGLLSKLRRKWTNIFAKLARDVVRQYVNKADEACTFSTFESLKVAGIEAPKARYNENVKNTLTAAEDYNTTLVTNIGAEVHEKIYNAVMLSLTSPNPEEQGAFGIQNALKEVGTFSENRIKFIAKDQTSKIYSSLSDQRLEENGCEEYDWVHSGGGKEPRKCHENMNGMRFKINDPRLWEVGGELGLKKGDLGPPGWAIGCKCKRRPVI